MMTVSLAVLVSANVLLKLSAKAKSILLILTSASNVALVPMFVLLKLSAWDNLIMDKKEKGLCHDTALFPFIGTKILIA